MEIITRWAAFFNLDKATNEGLIRMEQGLPENYAPMIVENIKKGGYTHVIAGHSAFGKNLMPRVAALLDSQQISDVTVIESEDSMSITTLYRLAYRTI